MDSLVGVYSTNTPARASGRTQSGLAAMSTESAGPSNAVIPEWREGGGLNSWRVGSRQPLMGSRAEFFRIRGF